MFEKWSSSALLASVIFTGFAAPVRAQEPARVKIGTFDSRAVIIAYVNSPQSAPERQALMEDKRLGPSRQHLMHQQAFSNASIVNIVPKFKDKLPEIAARRGVVMIASRWEVPYADPAIETVDVTSDIVELFKPTEKARKWIAQLEKVEPIPLQDVAYDPAH